MRLSIRDIYRTHPRQVACAADGSLLYATSGNMLELYDLRGPSGAPKFRRKLKTPGKITGIFCGVSAGPVLTVRGRGATKLMRLQRDALTALAELPETLVDILETAGGLFALVGAGRAEPSRILQLDAAPAPS